MMADPVVYVVEDDAGMRDAVSLLMRGAGFDVRGYQSAEAFLDQVDCSVPLCLLTDVKLPGMDGIALFRQLARSGTEPAVVVITGHGDIPMAVAALKEGVLDFVEKPFDPGLLLDSVRDASRRTMVNAEHRAVAADLETRRSTLTPRENEVLALLLEGHLNKTIASKLETSPRTTEHHRAHIMEKMAARSLSHLIRMMLEHGR
jgi:two-component system response regulator FixJ